MTKTKTGSNDNHESEQPQDFLENLQESLIKRFSRIPRAIEPIVYEFTHDKALLHQYYILRERMLGTDKFMPKGLVPEDVHDKISHILIARRGNVVIGGARLTIREGDEMFPLPMEDDNFKLRGLFPYLPLNKHRHAVVSKFAIMDDQKSQEVLYTLCKLVYEKLQMTEVYYMFVRATNSILARNWRLICNTLKPNSTRICTEIDVPDSPMYPGQKQRLVFTDLSDIIPVHTADEELKPAYEDTQPYLTLVH